MMTTMKTSTSSSPPSAPEISALVARPHRPASGGERRTGHEDGDEQPVDAEAERLDHLPVLDPGADQQPDARAVQHQMQRDENQSAEDEGEDAVDLDGDVADDQRTLQQGRARDADRRAAPDR